MHFRAAQEIDLPQLIILLQDDVLGKTRESIEALPKYQAAFAQIHASLTSRLVVGEIDGKIVAMAQLDIFNCLSHQGSRRGHIENVRVDSACRGQGVGAQLIKHLASIAQSEGCQTLQLSSTLSREKAIQFYESIGFKHTHAGLKMSL